MTPPASPVITALPPDDLVDDSEYELDLRVIESAAPFVTMLCDTSDSCGSTSTSLVESRRWPGKFRACAGLHASPGSFAPDPVLLATRPVHRHRSQDHIGTSLRWMVHLLRPP